MEIKPLNIHVLKAVTNGQVYDVMSYDEYGKLKEIPKGVAILEEYNALKVLLPVKGEYTGQIIPGVYSSGAVDFVVYPTNQSQMEEYMPTKIVDISNTNSMKEILQKEETLTRLAEPWITNPDNITKFPINEDDQPEMKCLKSALNSKNMDFDKYAPRFGENFPNDKRQLKNSSATLNIIKRFCEKCDMEAILVLKDKKPDVPNPIGKEISVSLTDNYCSDE